MCICERFAIICLDSIISLQERDYVARSLITTAHEIIDITLDQMKKFAGNALAIQTNTNKSILALSKSSFESLTKSQKISIEKYCELIPLSIRTIETIGGGSARCMIAEIFLQPIPKSSAAAK